MLRDLRLAVRMLLNQPGFTAINVMTLALGIGATAAVFSLIQGVLLTPPPYRQPDQLVLVSAARSDGQATRPRGWPAAQWTEWQKEAKAFESLAGYGWTFNFLVSDDGSESLEGMFVTPDYFRVLGMQPALGRTFEESDRTAPVIIIGYEFWQRRYNRDPNIVGKSIRISRRSTPSTVVGVMPAGARFLPAPSAAQEPNYNVNATVDFWSPAGPNPANLASLKSPQWNIVGRLHRTASLQQAQAELAGLAIRQAQADRDFDGFTPQVQSLRADMNREGRRILLPLLGASVLVLLIACGNVAALLLVRGIQRQQEYAVRSALGIGRVALFRQVSTESLLLSVVGGTFGVALAFGVVRFFKLVGGHAIPRLDAVTTGWPVLVGGLGAALIATFLAGIFPVLRASRLDPMQVLKSAGPKSSAGRGERRLLRGVAMVQTALTLALLVGAGLLIRTMNNLSNVQSGYDTGHMLTMTVTAVQGDWSDFHHRALERVSALPGVQYAAFAWGVPLTGNSWPASVEVEDQPVAAKESDRIAVPLRAITPDYFKLIGMELAAGRDFRSTDIRAAGNPPPPPSVAIVNQALANRYFRGANPIGKKVWISGRNRPPAEIVGVVTNGRTSDLTKAAEPEIYLSLWQASAFSKDLIVRTASDPRSLAAAVRRELRSVDPTAAVENVRTMEQVRSDSLASRTFAMRLLAGFSLVGSVLTLVGIYGVLSLSVASRRREIAIRAAMGAARSDIRNLVFAEGFRLIAGGVICGIAAALAWSPVLKSFLFEVEPADPGTFIAVGVLFAAVALLACWSPTRRAASVDPIEALRYE